jgi:hypothetical protein
MLSSLIRKIRQLNGDPVLRQWLVGRALGRWPGEGAFTPHKPPYLDGLLPLASETPSCNFQELPSAQPSTPLVLDLAGETLRVEPGQEAALFERHFDDTEILLSLHRFAWLADHGHAVDPAWVQAMWQAWLGKFAEPSHDWPWHPYTAAERAINILNFSRHHGLPGDQQKTLHCLASHAPLIAERLEYFGEHHTSNHLANNGRGLFILGLSLGLEKAARVGEAILLAEAERIISPSGLLREGSSHYHLLVTRNYLEAWLCARRHDQASAQALKAVAHKLLSAATIFDMPAGLPVVGDISPDCAPAYLTPILSGNNDGWLAGLDEEERSTILAFRDDCRDTLSKTIDDGWISGQFANWRGLWHADREGWSHMPGHGHQDIGSFDLHYGDEAVIIDPGRGAYGETGDAARYRAGEMHNALQVDGADPFPPNRPYYDETFRRKISREALKLWKTETGVGVRHHGFSRLNGVGAHERTWRFDGDQMVVSDTLEGAGKHTQTRTLITPLEVSLAGKDFILSGANSRFRISCADPNVATRVVPITRWLAYAKGVPANALIFTSTDALPFSGEISILKAD